MANLEYWEILWLKPTKAKPQEEWKMKDMESYMIAVMKKANDNPLLRWSPAQKKNFLGKTYINQ